MNYRLLSLLFIILLLSISPRVVNAQRLEAGAFDLPGTVDGQTTFNSVTFANPFSVVPVVVSLPNNEGSASSALRIRNVTTTGFEIAQVEPPGEDGQHAAMSNLSYFAMEPGTISLDNGLTIEAGSINAGATTGIVGKASIFNNETAGANNDNASTTGTYVDVSLNSTFAGAPAVLADIQTANNESASDPPPGGPSSPWITPIVDNSSASGFQLALQQSEVDVNSDGFFDVTQDENIGYIAFSQGTFTFEDDDGNTITLDSLISGEVIDGWEDTPSDGDGREIDFNTIFADDPLLVATIASNVGADGAWLRLADLTGSEVFLTADEEAFNDDERNHGAEAASIVAASQAFSLSAAVPEPTTIVAWTFSGLVAFVFYLRRRRA